MEQFLAQLNSMQKQIDTLQSTVDSLKNPASMPKEFAEAMRKRIIGVSNKAVADATVTLTKDPIGTLVALPFDGFRKLEDGKNYPYYNDTP